METVNNYWSLYLDSIGHISAFFIMFITEKQKGKKKKGKHSGWQQIRTSNGMEILQSSSARKHSCAETFTLSAMLKQLVYHPNQYSKPPRFLSSLLVQYHKLKHGWVNTCVLQHELAHIHLHNTQPRAIQPVVLKHQPVVTAEIRALPNSFCS